MLRVAGKSEAPSSTLNASEVTIRRTSWEFIGTLSWVMAAEVGAAAETQIAELPDRCSHSMGKMIFRIGANGIFAEN